VSNHRLVWSDEKGDQRKNKTTTETPVNGSEIHLKVRRLTSGKGRTVIEISGLPSNMKWCQELARDLKKKLGVGGSYKESYIEIHGEKLDAVTQFLDSKQIKWKKTGG